MKRLPVNMNYLLIAGTVLLLVICYELAFKQTIEAWSAHSQLKQQVTLGSDISLQPSYLNRKNSNLDKIIAAYTQDSVTFKNNVVNVIAALADRQKVKLTIIPSDDVLYHTPLFIIQKLSLEGSFFDLLKLTDTLQRTRNIGIIRSASWKIKKTIGENQKSQKVILELYMEIYRK